MIEQQRATLTDVVSLAAEELTQPGITPARAQFLGQRLKEATTAAGDGDEPALQQILASLENAENTARSRGPHAYEQFNLTETDTKLGRQYSLTLQPGQCLRDVFDAANTSYATHASDPQKRLISAAVYRGRLYDDPGVNEPVTEVTTYVVRPVIKWSEYKTLAQQMDRTTGKLIFIDSEEVHGLPRPQIAAIAALKLDKSVANGILVQPGKPEGDALEGKVVQALGGGHVRLFSVGLSANDCNDVIADLNVFCAGSGSASRN